MNHTFDVNIKTLVISAVVLAAIAIPVVAVEAHYLLNLWKGE